MYRIQVMKRSGLATTAPYVPVHLLNAMQLRSFLLKKGRRSLLFSSSYVVFFFFFFFSPLLGRLLSLSLAI
jgi:hypothetical protein